MSLGRQVWGHAWDNIDARVADVLENLNNPDGKPYHPRAPLVQDSACKIA